MNARWVLAVLMLSSPARADDPRGAWSSFRRGAAISRGAPTAAAIDASWSVVALTVGSEVVARTWDAPYPWGQIGRYTTRALYSGSWALLMLGETQAVFQLKGGKLDWVGEAEWRTDWMVPLDLPACPEPGAYGGCGVGVGTTSHLRVRPARSSWWYEVGGGWFEQRVANDALRTVAESTWVMTPLTAVYELRTNPAAPLALRVFGGPGVFFGMHAAHMHPTTRGDDRFPRRWSELYPLDAGIGPGGRVEARLVALRRVGLEAGLTVAPFVLGGPTDDPPAAIAPLDFPRQGVSVWRRLDLGLAYDDPAQLPFKVTAAVFGAELSDRPVERIGYRGVMLRFDVPLKTPGDT